MNANTSDEESHLSEPVSAKTYWAGPPLMKQIDGNCTIDLKDAYTSYRCLPPQRKLVLLLLRLAIVDQARELDFWPWTPKSEDPDFR
jgi:hypothetical protein